MLLEIEKLSQSYRPYPEWPICYEIYEGPFNDPKRKRAYVSLHFTKMDAYIKVCNYFEDEVLTLQSYLKNPELRQVDIDTINEKINRYDSQELACGMSDEFVMQMTDNVELHNDNNNESRFMIIYKLKTLKLNKTYMEWLQTWLTN